MFIAMYTVVQCQWDASDRTNIGTHDILKSLLGGVDIVVGTGNAKVAGLTADLHLTGLQYNLCSAIFFVRNESQSSFIWCQC